VPSYADQNGWILIYGQTTRYSNCWDVNSGASLTHNGGGDAEGLVSMVNYALQTYNGDPSKVFVYGASSGAMMTNLMAGSYPEVFNAGAAYSGVADACFLGSTTDPTPFGSNQTCAQGQINRSAQSWGDLARNSYPGYAGNRTRMQIWHGLADTLVRPVCATQALEQWGNVWGLSNSKNVSGNPSGIWTQVNYGDGSDVVGYFGQGVGHFAPMQEVPMLKFFGLM
jgi:acetylxylan esterase